MRIRPITLVLAAALASGHARGETPPSFGAQAELVTVDVIVLGPDGKPVSGLIRDDFAVKEDGQPQTLKAFEVVETVAPALQAPKAAATSASSSRVATNVAGPVTRRTFAVVFDDLHVNDLRIEQAKAAVVAFVTKGIRPGDRLLLFTTSDARYWATTRGALDEGWLAALAGVRSHQRTPGVLPCRITEYEAMRIEDFSDRTVCEMVSGRREALGCTQDTLDCTRVGGASAGAAPAGSSQQQLPTQLRTTSLTVAAEAHAVARAARLGSLRTLREMLRAVVALPGRKEVVFVSEGFPADPSIDLFREVRQEAARTNAAIHYFDPRGLTTGPEFLTGAATTSGVTGAALAMTLALWQVEDGGTKALADETGGRVLQTNDLVAGLTKVADESRVTYLLGYEPTNPKRDGGYRKLRVEVRRPGLEVRARAGYFAATSAAPSKKKQPLAPERTPAERAMVGVFDSDGVPLRLAVYLMGPAPLSTADGKTGVEVLVAGEVRLDALESRVKEDGRRLAEPTLRLLTGSREGESHESKWTLEFSLSDSAGDPWQPFVTRIAIGPGDHRARLVVQSGGRVGSVTTDFIVPPLRGERLSTPILSDRLLAAGSDMRVLPVARRSFGPSTTLHCWIELVGAEDTGAEPPRATASFAVRSSDGREWASGPATAMNVENGRPTRLISIPLEGVLPGEQELVLRVKDEVSGATFEQREPFRVEPDFGVR
ncbi:MAG TPA: VWA domain-containing protein [Vicinamibacteria bacterium]|nr:VWA domain-containing protein [Vicinamibacteria bacterium]